MAEQDRVFAQGEGNAWWQRNKEALLEWDPQADRCLQLLEQFGVEPRSVLEIGAANGYRLHYLHLLHHCRAVGVDISKDAVADGRQRHPEIELYEGGIKRVPLVDQFDAVIVNFVLHWVDRVNLLRAVAEVDRLVRDGGYLVVGDFSPSNKHRVAYHHKPGLYTYKQDYAGLLVASGLYRVVGMASGSHGLIDSEDERIAHWLLRKRLHDYYTERRADV